MLSILHFNFPAYAPFSQIVILVANFIDFSHQTSAFANNLYLISIYLIILMDPPNFRVRLE